MMPTSSEMVVFVVTVVRTEAGRTEAGRAVGDMGSPGRVEKAEAIEEREGEAMDERDGDAIDD